MTTINPGVRQMRLKLLELSINQFGLVNYEWIDQQTGYLKTGKHPVAAPEKAHSCPYVYVPGLDEKMSTPGFRYYQAPAPDLTQDEIDDIQLGQKHA